MEYVEGTDLSELIRRRRGLTPDDVAPILAQVASALAAAHGAGIVHRDVKPSNILVTPDGQVKLSDFGIARTSSDPALTQTGLVTGSPAYLSPEVASGQQATPASDVWSWGATLFHALEGRPPYQVGDNLLGALYRIVHEEPPPCEAAGWLAPVLAATMTRDPAQRWPIARAQDFLEAGPETQPVVAHIGGLADIGLADVDAAEPRRTRSYDDEGATQVLPLGTTTSPPPAAPAPRRDPDSGDEPRRPWPLVLGAALALVIVVVVAFAIGMQRGGEDDATESPSGPSSDAASSSAGSPDEPTEAGMTDFLETYIATASSDPAGGLRHAHARVPEAQRRNDGLPAVLGRRPQRGRPRGLGGPGHARGELHLPIHRGSRRAHRGRPRPEADLRERHLPHRPGAVRPVFTPEGEVFGGRFGVKCA